MKLAYLFQLPHADNNNLFRSYDRKPYPIKASDYVATWVEHVNDMTDDEAVEHMWSKFNCNLPENFAWHSLSVGDVVEIVDKDTNTRKAYYCDSFGWKDVSAEFYNN